MSVVEFTSFLQNEELELQYRSSYARILDAKRRFLEASQRYYELSQIGTREINGRKVSNIYPVLYIYFWFLHVMYLVAFI